MDKVTQYKEEILKIAKKEDDSNKTTFWHDRVLSGIKNNLPGATIGATIGTGGALAGRKYLKAGDLKGYTKALSKTNKAAMLAALAAAGVTDAIRLKNMHKKELGTDPTPKDYAKSVITQSLPVPGAALLNTPEAIVKAKKREMTQKKASSEETGSYKTALAEFEGLADVCTPEEIEQIASEALEEIQKNAGIGSAIINGAKSLITKAAPSVAKAGASIASKGVTMAAKEGAGGVAKGIGSVLQGVGNYAAKNPEALIKNTALAGGAFTLGNMAGKKKKGNAQTIVNIQQPAPIQPTASDELDEMYQEKVAKFVFKLTKDNPNSSLSQAEMDEFKALGARIDKKEKLTHQEKGRFYDLAERFPSKVLGPHFEKVNKTASEELDGMYREKIKK